jgi:two-component system NarL family sensor kinase
MAQRAKRPRLADLAAQPQLVRVLIDHAYRGVRVQLVLRGALVVFLGLTVILAPPVRHTVASDVIAAVYAAWYLALLPVLLRLRSRIWPVRYLWLTLYVDVLVIGALVVLAGDSAEQSWTSDILVNGFFLLPVMAATQLRPWVGVSVCAPALAVYLFASIVARTANEEPWSSIGLRTGVFAAVAVGCVLLSRVQQSRVLTIGTLVTDRGALLAEIMGIEKREREELAEQLHDGALQYVLAARHDLADARDYGDPESFDRLDRALSESSQLLRATVTGLHPAVLEQAGLRLAVEELAAGFAARGAFTVEVDADQWPSGTTTSADGLLYATARELLGNVLKHAEATRVRITLALREGTGSLTVSDDGRGLPEGSLEDTLDARLAAGHIGIASRRIRLEAAGGTLRLYAGESGGTTAEARVPVTPSTQAATTA